MLLTVLAVVISFALALVFTLSILAHFEEPSRMRDALVVLGLPKSLARLAAATEAALVTALFLSPQLGGVILAGYLTVVTATFGYNVYQGKKIEDCGCGKKKKQVGPSFFVRNTALIAAGVFIAVFGPAWLLVPTIVAAAIVGVLVGATLERKVAVETAA